MKPLWLFYHPMRNEFGFLWEWLSSHDMILEKDRISIAAGKPLPQNTPSPPFDKGVLEDFGIDSLGSPDWTDPADIHEAMD